MLGLGNLKDIANACIYLLSDASRWVTGSYLVVDGGGILLGEIFWKQILHKSIINYSQPVLIGRPTLDIEDGLAGCL